MTRHSAECDHAGNTQWRRCRCPKWVRDVLTNGRSIRESAETRSWEQAERFARKMEADANPTSVDPVQPRKTTVVEAISKFPNDEEAGGLEHSSRKKSRTLFESQFLPFCEAHKLTRIDLLMRVDMTEFRSTWNNGDVTTHRKHKRDASLLRFLRGERVSEEERDGCFEEAHDA